MADFYITKGDRQPAIIATLMDAANDPVDVSAATVKFNMRLKGSTGTPTVSASCTEVTDGTDGKVQYAWAATDTATAGTYEGEFEATWTISVGPPAVTSSMTFPNNRKLSILILDALG